MAGALGAFALMLAVVAASCSGGSDPAPPPGGGAELTFSALNWDSARVQTAIAAYIARFGYGRETAYVRVDPLSVWTAVAAGETDITMEVWLPNQAERWNRAVSASPPLLIDAGSSLDESWQDLFVIPQYIADRYPDLRVPEDLKQDKFRELFSRPDTGGKARLVTCAPGWACNAINQEKLESYGLLDYVEQVDPVTADGLTADLEGAYAKGEPWLGYLWGPTATSNELALATLQEAPYSDGCWVVDKRCEYPTAVVKIGVDPSLPERAPGVYGMLEKWEFDARSLVAVETWMAENGRTPEDAAAWFLETQDGVWSAWVPDDVAQKVRTALAEGKRPSAPPA